MNVVFRLFILFFIATGPAYAAESREFDLANFDRIDISAGVSLAATIGEPQSIRVETNDGDFSDFEIEVRNGELRISRDHNRLRWHSKKSRYKVYLTAPALRGFDGSSGSHAEIGNIDATRFLVDLSSGAYAALSGTSENCTADVSSGANLEARDLVCESVVIDVSSGGNGEIGARRSVVAEASSGGNFTVYGNPERVSVDKSSGGRVTIKPQIAAIAD